MAASTPQDEAVVRVKATECVCAELAVPVICRTSSNSVGTPTARFDVEGTLRGGHLVRVSSFPDGWIGLYRFDEVLVLIARCYGTPPSELQVSFDIGLALREVIARVCAAPGTTVESNPMWYSRSESR